MPRLLAALTGPGWLSRRSSGTYTGLWKGGAAWSRQHRIDHPQQCGLTWVFAGALFPGEATIGPPARGAGTVGAGIEHGSDAGLSFEPRIRLIIRFAATNVSTPLTRQCHAAEQPPTFATCRAERRAVTSDMQVIKLALNYHLGNRIWGRYGRMLPFLVRQQCRSRLAPFQSWTDGSRRRRPLLVQHRHVEKHQWGRQSCFAADLQQPRRSFRRAVCPGGYAHLKCS